MYIHVHTYARMKIQRRWKPMKSRIRLKSNWTLFDLRLRAWSFLRCNIVLQHGWCTRADVSSAIIGTRVLQLCRICSGNFCFSTRRKMSWKKKKKEYFIKHDNGQNYFRQNLTRANFVRRFVLKIVSANAKFTSVHLKFTMLFEGRTKSKDPPFAVKRSVIYNFKM